jgi:DNA-binding GntR family transcriptional regulator
MDMADGDAALDSAQPRRTPKPAATARRGATISAAIYRELRNEIVSMVRRPGDVIAEKDIARQYGVSRTPVREALLRLADEELVDIFPQVGTFVSRIAMAALPEALVIRKALEEAAVRYAAMRATASHILRFEVTLAQQREADAVGDFDGFHQADESFHALIAEAAGYPRFWTITQQVKVQVDRCRRLTLPAPGRMSRAIAEHQEIADAIIARDPDRAVRGVAAHIDGLGSGIADLRKMNPRYFVDRAGEPAAEPA